MSARYRGRRGGISSKMLMIMAGILVLTIILVIINIKKDKKEQAPDTKVEEQQATQQEQTPEEPQEPEVPEEPEDNIDDGKYEKIELTGDKEKYSAVYRIGNTGYEMYNYVESLATKYTDAVNKTADALQGVSDVYCLPIPLSSGIIVPDEMLGGDLFDDQAKACASIEGMLTGNAKAVPLYNILMKHRTEYVYYRTDHHWTGLGAYYAYVRFCNVKGITPHELSEYTVQEFDGYLGSFYNDTGKSPNLGNTPDTVYAYHPLSENAKMEVTDKNGNTYEMPIIYDESTAPAAYKYGAYIGGDNPFSVITNPDVTDGSTCVVVKESFGNAFVPFLVDHYSKIYVIDYRYWNGSLASFAKENKVDDVLFVNNLSAIRGSGHIAELYKIL